MILIDHTLSNFRIHISFKLIIHFDHSNQSYIFYFLRQNANKSFSEGGITLGRAPAFLYVLDHMGPTPGTHQVPQPGFHFDFYTDYGYTRVDVYPLICDKVKQITTKFHQIATSWSY